ncbi:MAG: hypothetical protein IKO10_06550 [Lachnospiraceae bacterium]|nr:hypothetical protein [Lachnospiraceae bacterium]
MRFIRILSYSDDTDSDDDGVEDSVDPHRLVSDVEKVDLPNIYSGIDYLNVDGANGGDQGWWGYYDKSLKQFYTSEDYRMGYSGCGVMAMTDLELYLTTQNAGYQAPYQTISYNSTNGNISKADYMSYAEFNRDNVYLLMATPVDDIVGVIPTDMVMGIENYLKKNNHPYQQAVWAPTLSKTGMISRIETMISNGIPVVFSYHSFIEDIRMYGSDKDAITMGDNKLQSPRSHYMTIIGYTKYLRDNGKDYGYILKVESWGNIYYINYDEYAKKISILSNILEIK